jgi:hypothetical protein
MGCVLDQALANPISHKEIVVSLIGCALHSQVAFCGLSNFTKVKHILHLNQILWHEIWSLQP